MECYSSCIARRTRAKEDVYWARLHDQLRMERGEIPKSKKNRLPKTSSTAPKPVDLEQDTHLRPKSKRGKRKATKSPVSNSVELEEDTYLRPKSKRGKRKSRNSPASNSVFSKMSWTRKEDKCLPLKKRRRLYSGFEGQCSSFDNENASHEPQAESEPKQGFHAANEVIHIESDDSVSASGKDFDEPDVASAFDNFRLDKSETKTSDRNQCPNSFTRGGHEANEVIDIDALSLDEFESENSYRNGINDDTDDTNDSGEIVLISQMATSNFEEKYEPSNSNEGPSNLGNGIHFIDSDESLSSSDMDNDDPNDIDYEVDQSYLSASEDLSSCKETNEDDYYSGETEGEQVDSMGSENKRSEKSILNVGLSGNGVVATDKKVARKVITDSSDSNENDQLEKTENEVIEGDDSRKKKAVCDVPTEAKMVTCKVRKHLLSDSHENDQLTESEQSSEQFGSHDSQKSKAGCDVIMKSTSKLKFSEGDIETTPKKVVASYVSENVPFVQPEEFLSPKNGINGDLGDSVQKSNNSFSATRSNGSEREGSAKDDQHEETEVRKIRRHHTKSNSGVVQEIGKSAGHPETPEHSSNGPVGNGATVEEDNLESLKNEKVGNGVGIESGINHSTPNQTQLKNVLKKNHPKVSKEDRFTGRKICRSSRHSETHIGNKISPKQTEGHEAVENDVNKGGKVESSGHEKAGNDMEVDTGVHLRIPNQTQLNKDPKNNPPKINEVDDGSRIQPTKKHEDSDLLKNLANSILGKAVLEGEGCELEAKRSCPVQEPINYKFSFEDEDAVPEEKSELEIEVEKLFEEMHFALYCEEMGSTNTPTVDNESPDNCDQTTLCSKGKHLTVIDEEIGLKCQHCSRVLLEIQYVMPSWERYTRRVSRRKEFCGGNGDFNIDSSQLKSSVCDPQNSCNPTEGTVWDAIPGTRESMYPHQQEGFEFLWKNLVGTTDIAELQNSSLDGVGGCIISHAPGTGKTRLTAVFVESYLKLFPGCRPVIVAPAGMLLTWEEEFRKWKIGFPFHNLNNSEFSGMENNKILHNLFNKESPDMKQIRMVKLLMWSKGNSILGVSYNLYEKLAGEKFIKEDGSKKRKKVSLDDEKEGLRKILLEYPDLVVLDEGHTPRNERSCIWNTLLKLRTEKRVILSGTPFQNNFGELFNTLHLVRPATADVLSKEINLGQLNQPRRKYSRRNGASSLTCSGKVTDDLIEKVKDRIAPFVHVHKGHILQQSLPGLRDSVVLLNPPPFQKHLISAIEGSCSTFEFEYKVAMISIHPYLIQKCATLSDKEKSIVDKDVLDRMRLEPDKGVKTRFLMEILRLSVAKKEKVLVFSQYVQPLELIKDQIGAVFGWNDQQILHMRAKTETKQRQILINRFNDPNDKSKIMLASTKCCSEGINLVGASRVVLLDVVWNPSVERQALSRAYRLGQKKVVYTYHLMTCDTTEWGKYCRQAEKDRLSELVFCSSTKENYKGKSHAAAGAFDDEILEEMVEHSKVKDIFEKIIHQPKETDLIGTFGLGSVS